MLCERQLLTLVVIVLHFQTCFVVARRRGKDRDRGFENKPGMGDGRVVDRTLEFDDERLSPLLRQVLGEDALSTHGTSTSTTPQTQVHYQQEMTDDALQILDDTDISEEEVTTESTTESTVPTTTALSSSEEEEQKALEIINYDTSIDSNETFVSDNATSFLGDNATDTSLFEEETTLPDISKNLTALWIDATYKAEDFGLNVSKMAECRPWIEYFSNNTELPITMLNYSKSDLTNELGLVEYEVIEDDDRLEELGLEAELLEEYAAVGILYKEICGNHPRELWFTTTENARELGIDENSPICGPFKIELNPNAETLGELASKLIEMIKQERNKTTIDGAEESITEQPATTTAVAPNERNASLIQVLGDGVYLFGDGAVSDEAPEVVVRVKRSPKKEAEDADDEDWLEELNVEPESEEVLEEDEESKKQKDKKELPLIVIDATDETNPKMQITTYEAAVKLNLNISKHSFQRYEKVILYLPGICADYVPTAIDEFNATAFEGVEIEGPIGVNITALEAAGVNLTELAEKLRNDTEVDEILSRTNGSVRTLGGSYILPVLNKNQYDPFSAPIVFQGSAVVVRFGIYIESMSNFQTSTMDYDMDIFLMMGWRDARLVNPFDKPILVKEEEILERIWRPDPFFANAKEAEFHEVTFLNFLMRIFPDGLVLYETRIKLKPACNLVLCKYPHDKQTCELQIKSFAYPIETVRFEWFTKKDNAIDKNPDVKLPELYIDRYEPTVCNRTRKSGDFSCLRAVFRLKRDVGFHIAQTYIPTSLALMFSWVGVWLPEEFMEGRIGVAITVLLTLSTESAGAREHLPSVSYLKAIDLWFGYITGFVFFTLLQTLFVIGFDKRASQLRKWATKKRSEVSQEARDSMMNKANRYHKTGRYLDNFCRVFYPLSFFMFLILYYFVFTEGRQDDCISSRAH
ncbi:hypothetical protein QR680_000601 [Steinernema hermaphroditum]|uniref:Neurotransmitter-gated ion-channel ligand-binding domain-containing protein n=1 Tax=Steinernema hermaphroditum TaxID=289476 RepID=A0AA39GV63_9BILA|nr:hypothetical protein QR680_000601 [Steinernema hermaphroditum]